MDFNIVLRDILVAKITLTKPNEDEMCAVGFHVVRGHERICHSGTRTWVDAHLAKNPGGNKSMHLKENLFYLYWRRKITPSVPINSIKGFPAHHEVDALIQFWIAYWQDQGLKFPDGFDPLIVKVIMAVESSFNVMAASKQSTAVGLMQVTGTARIDLSGRKRDGFRYIRNQLISVSHTDLQDPLINIAVAIRWLAVKFAAIPKGNDRTVFNMLKAYNDWGPAGEAYAKRVLQLYERSK